MPADRSSCSSCAEPEAATDGASWNGPLACWLGDCRMALRRIVHSDEHVLRVARWEVIGLRAHRSPLPAGGDVIRAASRVADEPLSATEEETASDLAARRCAARDQLQSISARSRHGVPLQGDALIAWALTRPAILRRMVQRGLVPSIEESARNMHGVPRRET